MMSKVFNQFNFKLNRTGTLLSVLCFTLVLSTVQPVPVMANDVCALQWYKKVAKKAKSAKNRVKKTAKSAARKTKSYAKKGAGYAKKGATTVGRAGYKAATSKTGRKIGKFVKEEYKASEVGKMTKGLTSKTARNFYKHPVNGTKKAIKSGIHKAKTDPGKYAKQFIKGRAESSKLGRIYSRGKKAVSIGKRLKNTSTGKKVTGYVKDKASSAAREVAKRTQSTRNTYTRAASRATQKAVQVSNAVYHGNASRATPASSTRSSSSSVSSSKTANIPINSGMTRKQAKRKLEDAAGQAAIQVISGLFSKKSKSTATPSSRTKSSTAKPTPVKRVSKKKSANSAVYNLLNSAYKKKK